MNIKIVRMQDLVPDPSNANMGTERGNAKLEDSIQKHGHGRSGLIDKNGKIIAGNKFYAKSGELGAEEAILVESDGTKPVFVQRTDLDLDTDLSARMMAYYDNFVSMVDLAWDESVVTEDLQNGLPLDELWTNDELSDFLGVDDLPYEKEKERSEISFTLTVNCKTEEEVQTLYNELSSEYDCDMRIG